MGKPTRTTTPSKVTQENRMEAYLVSSHGGRELTIIVTTSIDEALRQAREEEVVREAVRRDGGICIYPLRD